jgi:hypothetical protein
LHSIFIASSQTGPRRNIKAHTSFTVPVIPNTSHNKRNGGTQTTILDKEITNTNTSERRKAARCANLTTLFKKFVFIICEFLEVDDVEICL